MRQLHPSLFRSAIVVIGLAWLFMTTSCVHTCEFRNTHGRVIPGSVVATNVPIFFLLGRYDWHISAVLAEAYFETIEAPCKRLVWFEQSAHNPPFEEPEKFNEVLIKEVFPLVAQRRTQTCGGFSGT